MVRAKICGITNLRDAQLAVREGAHALGFIFADSPRRIRPDRARIIIDALPPDVGTVGVFVDEDTETVRGIADFCRLGMIQFHGNESPALCRRFMPHAIKAFRMSDPSSLCGIKSYQGNIRALVLDTYQQGTRGGTGRTFDWNLALRAKGLGIPLVLSGGLNPSNLRQAVSRVGPYAVDVNSGIEERPGIKDPARMKKIMEIIRDMNQGETIDEKKGLFR
jgi:phosphoribosylanthranilate isomerase